MPTENKNNVNAQADDDPDVQDPGRTEFANIAENIDAMSESLKRMKDLNPQSLRMFLLNDLFPLLKDWADTCNWYTGDLHARVSEVEEEVGGEAGEGLDPEFAGQLIEFIGVSLQLFGVLVNVCKNDLAVLGKVQLLIAQAPGLIAKIQEITLEEQEDEDEDDEDDEEDEGDAEVLEPKGQQATPVLEESAPVVQPVELPPSGTAAPADVVPVTSTADPNPDVVATTTTSGEQNGNG